MKKGKFHFVELTIYYIAIFIMLREWLIPISQLTKTGYLELILLFVAMSMVISILKGPMFASIIIKIIYIAWFTVYVYTGQLFFTLGSFSFLGNEIKTNLTLIMNGHFFDITDPFRSVLFLILIWMFLYLIEHWITDRMSIVYFLLFTIFFIAVLDTFTVYDGTVAIIKIIVLGLMMMAFLMLKRLHVFSKVQFQWSKFITLAIPIILVVGITSSAAIVLPKAEPQWPDPVPFLKSVTGQDWKSGVSKVGYDEDDHQLGGSFVGDDTVVFTVQADSKQYWRVETKDVYTSKGWEKSTYFNEWFIYRPNEVIGHSLPVGPIEEMQEAYIQVFYPYNFILQSYGFASVSFEDESLNRSIELFMDGNSEIIIPYLNRKSTQIESYYVQYSKPTYKYSELMDDSGEIDPLIKERYLQLPSTLPQRVGELAAEIVEGKTSTYEKARAIEQYFAHNGFRYDTENVPVPAEGQDYVDQFLFESKFGYCDNFSTSMVVLLRSIGIPARWVKGFAGGDQINSNGEMKTFEITNNEAHSWVEAYIPNVGWINFEPTIGFSNNRSIDYDVKKDEIPETELVVDEDTEPTEQIDELEKEKPEKNKELKGFTFGNLTWLWVSLLILSLGIVVLGYKIRKKWLPKVYLRLVEKKTINEDTFELLYLRLLKMLELQGLKRNEGQTLQDFAKEVDAYFGTDDMFELTKAYEQFIYGRDQKGIDFKKVKESWEYLINRCSG